LKTRRMLAPEGKITATLFRRVKGSMVIIVTKLFA